MHVHECIDIRRPAEVVWADVSKLSTHVEWMADAESIEFQSAVHAGIGADFICLTRVGPIRMRDRMTVTDWRENESIAIDHRGLVTGAGRFTLTALDESSTRFCWDEILRFPPWAGGPLGGFVAQPILRRLWARNLRRLKARIEQQ